MPLDANSSLRSHRSSSRLRIASSRSRRGSSNSALRARRSTRESCSRATATEKAECRSVMNEKRELLRHALATIAYRGGKPLRDAPASFATFQAGGGVKTPVEILAHVGDLFDWAVTLIDGDQKWRDQAPLAWDREVERFFAT